MRSARYTVSLACAVALAIGAVGSWPACGMPTQEANPQGQEAAVAPGDATASPGLIQRVTASSPGDPQVQPATGQLRSEDQQVLSDNPQMMQKAGAMTTEEGLLLGFGVIVIILLVVIAA